MKVLLINGSPRERGCTYTALSEVARTLEEEGIAAELLHLGREPIPGCLACGRCRERGQCVFNDLVNATAARLEAFDGLILGTPVYYAAASGQLTAFLNRLFYAAGKKLAGKPGACVVSCRRGGAAAAFDQLNKYFTINQMPVVSSQYWNQVHGNSPKEVLQDAEGLQTLRTLGRNMAWLLKCIEAGRLAGIQRPEAEPVIRTNFIR